MIEKIDFIKIILRMTTISINNIMISSILEKNNLEKYIPLFKEHKIDMDIMPHVSHNDLKEIGVVLGDRIRIKNLFTKTSKSSQHLKKLNNELDCYELSKKLFNDDQFNQNVYNEYCTMYNKNTVNRILSYLPTKYLSHVNNYSQGVLNASFQKEEIHARYSYLNNKSDPDLVVDLLNDNWQKYHPQAKLTDEETQYKLLNDYRKDYTKSTQLNLRFLVSFTKESLLRDLHHITNNQLKHLSYNGYVVAGGIITRIFFGLVKNISSDIDIFLIGKYDELSFKKEGSGYL